MKFKVHKVEELYPDLEKYDLRAQLGDFTFVKEAKTVEYYMFVKQLKLQGYIEDAEVYYLNPSRFSRPPADLIKIDGAEDVKQMMNAHAEEETKICHLYLVSTYPYQDPDVSFRYC